MSKQNTDTSDHSRKSPSQVAIYGMADIGCCLLFIEENLTDEPSGAKLLLKGLSSKAWGICDLLDRHRDDAADGDGGGEDPEMQAIQGAYRLYSSLNFVAKGLPKEAAGASPLLRDIADKAMEMANVIESGEVPRTTTEQQRDNPGAPKNHSELFHEIAHIGEFMMDAIRNRVNQTLKPAYSQKGQQETSIASSTESLLYAQRSHAQQAMDSFDLWLQSLDRSFRILLQSLNLVEETKALADGSQRV